MDCIICQIVHKKLTANILYEDEKTLAFLDHHPSSPGHTLVALKKHGGTLLDYSPEDLGALMSSVQRVIKALEKSLGTGGLSIGINHRELAGIHHLHIHLIPRFVGDGGEIIQNLVYNKTSESLNGIAEKIRKNYKPA